MVELEILGVPQSSLVRTVRIACEEKGVAYRLTVAMPHSPEILAINPLGKVPAMRCSAFQLFESFAIAAYIDRAYPGPKLFPDDPELCGRITQWVSVLSGRGPLHVCRYELRADALLAAAMPREQRCHWLSIAPAALSRRCSRALQRQGDGTSAVRGSGAAAALSYDGPKVARETNA